MFGHKLPNGWTFGLPNELYLTKTGKSFDVQGVPSDIRVPVYPKTDLESARDGAIDKALEILKGIKSSLRDHDKFDPKRVKAMQ